MCRWLIAAGKRPVPFRTRKLSPPAPMVLLPGGSGRVGYRRPNNFTQKHPEPSTTRAALWVFSRIPTPSGKHPTPLLHPHSSLGSTNLSAMRRVKSGSNVTMPLHSRWGPPICPQCGQEKPTPRGALRKVAQQRCRNSWWRPTSPQCGTRSRCQRRRSCQCSLKSNPADTRK